MKTYKSLFWIACLSFIILLCYFYLRKLDYDYEVSSKTWDIQNHEYDIRIIDEILSKSDQSRHQIDSILKGHYPSDSDGFRHDGDTIFLSQSKLIFKNGQLTNIANLYARE
ncbi:hypothetical protein [uncultured Psychroserpens sp.]|uniref:hypothetical protein n=1 Tax=uncultured Psychroserpens sp. TaxID=255436 RepID=UPI002623AE7E|nr:hypothetical protein [uncultured Psychroserpens sp.]